MKSLKKVLLLLLSIVLIFGIYLVFNALNFKTKQINYEPIEVLEVNSSSKENFSKAIKIKTISPENAIDFDSIQFHRFTNFLKNTYPLVDSLLEKKMFNSFSFLYKWSGSDLTLKPIILMAHLDVVPVIKENTASWKHYPFGGEIINDTIWGRGTIDNKVGVVGIMESLELLLKDGFLPKRSIYIAFGHDEEIGGLNGAKIIAQYLKEEKIEAEFVLDEGGIIVQKLIPGIEKDVALIGIAEKGFVSLELSVSLEGGHSSMPEKETAIDVLSNAIVKLKQNPFPATISPPIEDFIKNLGPEMPFINKLVFANKSIFKSLITGIYEESASGNALVRTTTSPTIFNSGVKDNIIPLSASATINFRIIPKETIATVLDHVNKIINDERITIKTGEFVSEPSKVSSTSSFGYKTLHKTISEIYPTALVTPSLVIAGTDSRHFNDISDNIYRFSPIKINKGNI
ncbi:MAG: M20/M25/M40 family metallo-hydrolase [Flavobacteriaceae bacterium]|nr:M20/M25/M40 family metallo-hydrolase [Flavobacteriaceae bacterium]